MKYLLLFTISPVQTFISQARKTQDLKAGSQILSDLIGLAMDKIKTNDDVASCKFIFPSINLDSKPNRFIAIIEADEDKIKGIGKSLEDEIMFEFTEEVDFGGLINGVIDCKDQLKDFLKINWVARIFDVEPSKYKNQIANLERTMGAIKNLRKFDSFSEKGRKCAVNGEYNVKFYRLSLKDNENASNRIKRDKNYSPSISEIKNDICLNKLFIDDVNSVYIIEEGEDKKRDKISMKHLQNGEGICAITFLKRLYKDKEFDSFPSTAKIALLDTLNHQDLKTKADSYINQIRNHQRSYADEQLYFKENLDKDYLDKRGLKGISDDKTIDIFKSQLSELEKEAKELGLQFSKYYAILVFDADSMGTKLAKCEDVKQHQELSDLLGSFAKIATEFIDGKKAYTFKDGSESSQIERGRTVYAGGDDFLGLINLNHLFESVKDLRKIFDEEVNEKLTNQDLQLSFSAGIAIAHYKSPLSEVLNYARAMEKKAKNIEEKDSFSLAVLKHSGEIHETMFKWFYKEDSKTIWTTEIAKRLSTYLGSKQLSDKFITTLGIEFEKLMDKEGKMPFSENENPEFHEIFRSEIYRLAKRASKLKDSDLKEITDLLFTVYEKSEKENRLSLQNFINFLSICEFIGRNLNSKIVLESVTL
jgi:CRISPR-associated protein Cmr2